MDLLWVGCSLLRSYCEKTLNIAVNVIVIVLVIIVSDMHCLYKNLSCIW